MDNPAMAHLIPATLLSKKDVLFGNMSEIYQFHKRWASFKGSYVTSAFKMVIFTL